MMRLAVVVAVAAFGFAAGAGAVMATRHHVSPAAQALAYGAAHSNDSDDWP